MSKETKVKEEFKPRLPSVIEPRVTCCIAGEVVLNKNVVLAESIKTYCRTFQPHRPSSTAYKTKHNLQSLVIDFAKYLLKINSPLWNKVAMTVYNILLQ